ncbi:response regulator transcription factor [Actinotignum sp. GS-2025f]|uniref:response regulator transcription factor n=1 Tax=unclassified Actinotignum TaxID=2632702 RepID=UPI002A824A30|nr:response regulator transcription factor [Actinotignum sp. SLA_B059]MDY5128038.1 response regulator transcription factor [Actinotignum sp. SLA_B059]
MTTILVVDDEPTYRDTLAFNLGRDGYEVVTAADGAAALEQFQVARPDVVLLDLMLPGMSGEEVCRRIRATSDVPIIMLTAKDSEIDKVVGLEVGADDYVTKPYSYRELVARVRAVLRRASTGAADDVDEDVLRVGRVEMDTDKHEVYVGGELISMPLREFELLELFLRNPDRVLTRPQILDRIWGLDYMGDTKTLDVHVKRIRSKIEVDPSAPTALVTVRGLGYKLVSE